ncbi:hypothetical protein ACP70R_014541 [Stipagrostis hirtigluma subsp. patula]
MDGGNSTGNCSAAALRQCASHISCDPLVLANLYKSMETQIWRVSVLLLINVILAGVIVGTGAYGHRYRHHPLTRFIFLGASTLFLPIISSIVSSIGWQTYDYDSINYYSGFRMRCIEAVFHGYVVISCAFLVQKSAINSSTIVAADEREGRNIGPPFELLVQGVWTLCLCVSTYELSTHDFQDKEDAYRALTELIPFIIIWTKLAVKYYAFEKARQSYALGRNPRLIVGYMQQLQVGINRHGEPRSGEVDEVVPHPPPLLVMGEAGRQVEKLPRGYVFKDEAGTKAINPTGLVTIHKIWQLEYLPPPLKDLCLSFALFKLLRCRFARYELASAGSVDMIWSMLLKNGGHAMAFRVIADNLSFIHDYYCSPLPISYSKCWIPILSISISLLSIGSCIMTALFVSLYSYVKFNPHQIYCYIRCRSGLLSADQQAVKGFGSKYVDLVAVCLILVLVVIAEVRDISSYVCSNWTKILIICSYVNRASSQHTPRMQKWVLLLLQHRCKLMKHWDEKLGQCSELVLRPRKTPLALLRHFLSLPDQKTKVKVSSTVMSSIIDTLRSSRNGQRLSNGKSSLRHSQVGESFLWACNGKGTSDTILSWHIATSILEVRHPYHDQQDSPLVSTHKIVRTFTVDHTRGGEAVV